MYEKKIPLSLNCGLDLIGEVLYGKWKIRLLWFINEGYKRPSELRRKMDIMLKLTPPLDILTPLSRLSSVQLMT
ncbi:Uncharacterised protein [Sphingobacterium thalpophilum]|uniref:HTH hxlR-type domain-containing protein n=1 Tax=Sphingobacterium thalpophilum TaxID=259 RepID=A0A4U9VYT8_9SPHI|nr:Uncharacterised protein [Sphingobacterium thalpophilum]